jgi:hypothetical protein
MPYFLLFKRGCHAHSERCPVGHRRGSLPMHSVGRDHLIVKAIHQDAAVSRNVCSARRLEMTGANWALAAITLSLSPKLHLAR